MVEVGGSFLLTESLLWALLGLLALKFERPLYANITRTML